ncbi:hypothetical protein LRS13_08305 [Svornostia abyssi]|uniref:Uncharacterized protein n=1 Tax=Svornostia abyssi TaxID=2898438 RepID=A0ABY5PLS6_9ACTN|nr:hypothetical protein LRS13_08305 [Parviterribacteraceae bacterium J379]
MVDESSLEIRRGGIGGAGLRGDCGRVGRHDLKVLVDAGRELELAGCGAGLSVKFGLLLLELLDGHGLCGIRVEEAVALAINRSQP